MTALATIEQLQARIGKTLSGADIARATALLDDASAAFRRAAGGQQITQATTTDRVRVVRGKVRLPQAPVTDVTAVTDENGNALLYRWHGGDTIDVSSNVIDDFAWVPWSNPIPVAVVTYTHGYATVPDDVVAVVCQMAARAFGSNPETAGIQQESIGGYSYSIGAAAAAGAVGMLPAERLIAEAYDPRRAGVVFAL